MADEFDYYDYFDEMMADQEEAHELLAEQLEEESKKMFSLLYKFLLNILRLIGNNNLKQFLLIQNFFSFTLF